MNSKKHMKLAASVAAFILIGAVITACAAAPDMPGSPPPGAFPPMIFADDVLFITTGSLLNPTLCEDWVFLGEVAGYVSDVPAQHLQTNFSTLYVQGEMTAVVNTARVYWLPNAAFPVWSPDVATSPPQGTATVYGDGVIIDVNGQHFHFASISTRERMDDILFGR